MARFAIMPLVAILVLGLDQAVKAWAIVDLQGQDSLTVIEGFARLRYTQNTGAAFGIFQGGSAFLSVMAVAIILTIIFSANRIGNGSKLSMLALGLVTGGALGNLLDRVRLGYVVDFVDVYGLRAMLGDTVYIFPVFNVADSAITVGVILLMATLIFGKHEQPVHIKKVRPTRYISRKHSPWFTPVHPSQQSHVRAELDEPGTG